MKRIGAYILALLQAVTSDSILFACRKKSTGGSYLTDLYRIGLTRDTWELEYVTQIRSGG